MLRIDTKTKMIMINRGDRGSIEFSIKNEDGSDYIFQIGDIITFGVYAKKHMEGKASILKNIEIEEETTSVIIELTPEETKIGDIKNIAVDYWYEIQINHQDTIIGYDKDKEKIFRVYPEGSDTK